MTITTRKTNNLLFIIALLAAIVLAISSETITVHAAMHDANVKVRNPGFDDQQAEQPIYAVGIFKSHDNTKRKGLRRYLHQITPFLETHGGHSLTAPIHVRGNLKNSALPATTVNLDADLITIAEFPNVAAFQTFATDPDVMEIEAAWSEQLADEIRFLGVIPPEFAIFPVLGSEPFRAPPAFLLLNAIQIAPGGFDSFNRYSAQAVPMASAAGTRFFAPIAPITVLTGEFDYTFFAITEWTSRGAFQQFHRSPEFLDIVYLRNDVVTKFIEAGGRTIRH